MQKHHPLSPKVDKRDQVAFNGRQTIAKKTELALERGLAGVMIWEVGQDCRLEAVTSADGSSHVKTCPNGRDSSLLVALNDAIVRAGRRLARFKRPDAANSRQEL